MNSDYKFIAIEGSIGAGKTTLAKILSKSLNAQLILEQFSDNPFLPHFYSNPERHAFSVELFFMAERHKQFQEHFQTPSLFSKQQIVSDYIFEKTVLFAQKNLNKDEFKLFQRLFSILQSQFKHPDILIYLYRDVDILLKNIEKRGRSYEANISADYLQTIQTGYLDYFKTIDHYPILILDLADLDFTENQIFKKKLLQRLAEKHDNGMKTIKM